MKKTILTLDGGHPGQIEAMSQHFDIIRPGKPDPERVIHEHKNQIQAITTFLTPVSRSLIEALPNLEIIATGAVGLDHIDLTSARSRSIAVTNTPDVLTDDTADVAMLLMLNVARRAVEGDAYIRAGLWKKGPLALGSSLSGKRIGIVGMGRIGQAVAKRAAGFNMKISYFGPNEKAELTYQYYGDLKTLATQSDFLVITCPGGEKTRHMIDYNVLMALGPAGCLINVSRGTVVKEDDLLIALRNKGLAGAGLDVYENEPHVPEALLTMDNVVLTPHIGSATRETREKMGRIVVENLLAHFEGRALLTPVS